MKTYPSPPHQPVERKADELLARKRLEHRQAMVKLEARNAESRARAEKAREDSKIEERERFVAGEPAVAYVYHLDPFTQVQGELFVGAYAVAAGGLNGAKGKGQDRPVGGCVVGRFSGPRVCLTAIAYLS